jgi:hypothetical protein
MHKDFLSDLKACDQTNGVFGLDLESRVSKTDFRTRDSRDLYPQQLSLDWYKGKDAITSPVLFTHQTLIISVSKRQGSGAKGGPSRTGTSATYL